MAEDNTNCSNKVDFFKGADFFHGVFNYLNKMLMEEDDLATKPCMLTNSLALQATEKSFYDVLVDSNNNNNNNHYSFYSGQETKRLELQDYDAAVLCADLNNLWLDKTCSSASLINHGNARRKRRKGDVESVDLSELLTRCAAMVACSEITEANQILKTIRKHSSPNGSSSKRLAHYFANAIEARLSGNGAEVYRGFSSTTISGAQILTSYKAYIAACPFHRMSNIFANKSIWKLAIGRDKLHVVDFGILYGFQWPCIIEGLSMRPGGPPKLRITGIDFPQPGLRPAGRVEETGCRLAEYAKRFNVPFEYNSIAKNWENIAIEDLKIDPEEMLVVNSIYRMRNVLDETVVEHPPRDAVLKFIRKLKPDMFVHGVLNGAYNASYFLSRFRHAIFHFTALFDMLEATTSKSEDEDRKLIEQEVFGRDIMNAVACEGRSRVERPETYQEWDRRNSKAGFVKQPLNSGLMDEITRKVEKHYHKDFMVHEDDKWMLQGWKGKVLYALSLWTTES
uniref:scarecrow-like protein 14 n=1 Tax=Erigeron canadensis TaxID=72917 RepID=UPI001CB9C624|nr:scarecrow-like protein 14 [Erigeron canadensis]